MCWLLHKSGTSWDDDAQEDRSLKLPGLRFPAHNKVCILFSFSFFLWSHAAQHQGGWPSHPEQTPFRQQASVLLVGSTRAANSHPESHPQCLNTGNCCLLFAPSVVDQSCLLFCAQQMLLSQMFRGVLCCEWQACYIAQALWTCIALLPVPRVFFCWAHFLTMALNLTLLLWPFTNCSHYPKDSLSSQRSHSRESIPQGGRLDFLIE